MLFMRCLLVYPINGGLLRQPHILHISTAVPDRMSLHLLFGL